MRPKIGLLFISLCFAAAFFIPLPSRAEDRATPADNPFAGKVITVYFKGDSVSNGQVIENAEFKEVRGRTMIVGIGADTGQKANWSAGVSVAVAWDSVAVYYAMTREQFNERAQKQGK